MGLDADGATAYIEKYNAMVERINDLIDARAAARAAANSGADLFGLAEAVVGTVVGDDDSADGDGAGGDNDGASGDSLFSDDAGDGSTPLGDAQPFEYTPDAVSGER